VKKKQSNKNIRRNWGKNLVQFSKCREKGEESDEWLPASKKGVGEAPIISSEREMIRETGGEGTIPKSYNLKEKRLTLRAKLNFTREGGRIRLKFYQHLREGGGGKNVGRLRYREMRVEREPTTRGRQYGNELPNGRKKVGGGTKEKFYIELNGRRRKLDRSAIPTIRKGGGGSDGDGHKL